MPVKSFSQQLYFIMFINNCTRYTQVHLMCHKSKVLSKLQAFITMYKTHSCIHILKSDHSSKYFSNTMQEWMAHHSIQHMTAPTYSPNHNSVTEQSTAARPSSGSTGRPASATGCAVCG